MFLLCYSTNFRFLNLTDQVYMKIQEKNLSQIKSTKGAFVLVQHYCFLQLAKNVKHCAIIFFTFYGKVSIIGVSILLLIWQKKNKTEILIQNVDIHAYTLVSDFSWLAFSHHEMNLFCFLPQDMKVQLYNMTCISTMLLCLN